MNEEWTPQQQNCHGKANNRVELERKFVTEDCVEGWNGEWLVCVEQALNHNKFHSGFYVSALRNLLVEDWVKDRGMMIVGPTNCDKTCLFKPPTNNVQSLQQSLKHWVYLDWCWGS